MNVLFTMRVGYVNYIKEAKQYKKKKNPWIPETNGNDPRSTGDPTTQAKGETPTGCLMAGKRQWRSRCIRSAREIHEVLKKGKEIKTQWYRLVFLKCNGEAGRFAVLVSKRLGKATERNRIKRRMREILRCDTALESSTIHMVIIPKSCVLHEDIRVLADAFHKTMMDIQP